MFLQVSLKFCVSYIDCVRICLINLFFFRKSCFFLNKTTLVPRGLTVKRSLEICCDCGLISTMGMGFLIN